MSGSMRSASLKRFVKFAIAITRGSDDLLLVEVLLQVFQRRVADRRRATSDAVGSARICSSHAERVVEAVREVRDRDHEGQLDDLLLVEVLLQVFQRRVADRRRATSDAVVSARICSSVTPTRFDEAVCARVQYSHPVHDCHERLLPVGLPS